MIIQTSRISCKGGIQYLARHLLDKTEENEAIEILVGDRYALDDAHALARAKACTYSIRHLSISPQEEMTPRQLGEFLHSIVAEFRISPERPRLLVRHIKNGRSHFHFAVAEVDPNTLRVLDSRNDFARLERLAREYEKNNGETIQPTRGERQRMKAQGFSNVARKRSERTAPEFDRTKLKHAFAAGRVPFFHELKEQGLEIDYGKSGPILVNGSREFVAAASRASGVTKRQFVQFMEEEKNVEKHSDGRNEDATEYTQKIGNEHRKAASVTIAPGTPGRSRSGKPDCRNTKSDLRRTATTSAHASSGIRQGRSHLPSVADRMKDENRLLYALGKQDLDELLGRARKIATWMCSIFEPKNRRLIRQIKELKLNTAKIGPAETTVPAFSTYNYSRRMAP